MSGEAILGAEFSGEQTRWLEGFASGAAAVKGLAKAAPVTIALSGSPIHGPENSAGAAQDRVTAAGGKLNDQEKWKRNDNPLDAYARLKAEAEAGRFPKPDDNFRWRYHGLFYVAPAQASFMSRLRVAGGILRHWQLAALADLTESCGAGHCDITTRANVQVRDIAAAHGPAFVEGAADIGLIAKGAGADNIRNITGSATAGIDASELVDTRPHARAMNHHILNSRALYGLPRKFNIAFDGGGAIASLEETNDVGFQAVQVIDGPMAGLRYRLVLGGISGHKDLARDTGVVVGLDEAVPVADAILRVFIDSGDRTNRAKARLKYVLDAWGFEKFLTAIEENLGRKLERVAAALIAPRQARDRLAHIGVHPQKQAGLNWVGVGLPVGRLTAAQMRVLAEIARQAGDGDLRLTVWQNLLISGVPEHRLDDVKANIVAAGLDWQVSNVRAGLVACTGSRGCKFANADTKGDALAIADHLESRLTLDAPLNIHLTGCPNSCAQHYVGDIGLIGVKVTVNDEGDQVAGYDIVAGGGYGAAAKIGAPVFAGVQADEAPARIESLLRAWRDHRRDAQESFQAFTLRHEAGALQALAAGAMP